MFEADTMEGKWVQKEYESPKSRHGCMIPIDEATYQNLLKAFDK